METPNTQISLKKPSSNLIQSPLPNPHRSRPNTPIAYFPPLILEGDRDNPSPLLFPLVPTLAKARQKNSQALNGSGTSRSNNADASQTTQGPISENGEDDGMIDSKEFSDGRNSWSYWTGEKARSSTILSSEKMQSRATSSNHQTTSGRFEASPEEIESKYPGPRALKVAPHPDSRGPGPSQEFPQPSQRRNSLAGEAKPSYLNPLPTPATLVPMAQRESTSKGLNTKIQKTRPPLYRYNLPPHITNNPQFSINDPIPRNGSLQGRGIGSEPNRRRSYSLTMNSHPPFRLTRSNSWSKRQRRGFLPQGPNNTGNIRRYHGAKSAPYSSVDMVQRKRSLQRSESGIAHSRAFEKHLLRSSSGKSISSLHQYPKRNQSHVLLSNSYQPPRGTLPKPKRYSTRSLNSNHSTNFSYPRTYSDPSNPKRHSTSSSSAHNDPRYDDQLDTTMSLGKRGGSHSSYETSTGFMRRMSKGGEEATNPGSLREHLEMYDDRAPNAGKTRTNEDTLAVSQRPSTQSQSTYQSNFYTPEGPISPVRTFSHRSTNEPRMKTDSQNYEMPSPSWSSPGVGLDGEVYDNVQTTTSSKEYPNPNKEVFSSIVTAERRRLDNFGFTSTLDAASRPYTPDQFVTEAGLTHHDNSATRNPSGKSGGSWRSSRHARRQSAGSTRSVYTISRSGSSGHGRNAFRRQIQTLSIWPSVKPIAKKPWDFGDGSPSSSPASTKATVGLGIIGAFREKRKVTKELKDTADHPHTATTCAGPTRGSIRENTPPPPLRPDVYQPDATQSRLNSLAREGKTRYETVAREIRQLIATQNESEKAKRDENQYAVKSENPSQSGTIRVTTRSTTKPPASNVDAVRIKSPTSTTGYLYVSTVYNESQRIVERIWERGIGGRFANSRIKKNNAEKSLRYGSSGKKVKVYMRGARGESLTMLEKIGRKVGISNPGGWGKGRASAEANEKVGVNENENDPLGIGLCGAIDITDGRRESRDPGRWGEGELGCVPPIGGWKEFEEGKLVDPVKLKLEGENSKKYWSSKDVEVETTLWGRFRKLITKKATKAE